MRLQYFALLLLLPFFLNAAAARDQVELRSTTQLRYELGILQTELLQTRERIESQESIIEALRREMESHLNTNKELVKGTVTASEGKVSSVEKVSKDLAADMVKLKDATESALKDLDKHVAKLEKEIEGQSKNLRHLESALKAVLEAVGGDKGETLALSADKAYIVKDGDSLGKIAIAAGTTVKALKELNNLTKDSIRVGQKIFLP